MRLERDVVAKVALLARLEFSDADLASFTDQLAGIVEFIEQLNEVPTEGIEPMAHPLDVDSVLRPDAPGPSLQRAAALANAPQHDEECFLVPPVMARS